MKMRLSIGYDQFLVDVTGREMETVLELFSKARKIDGAYIGQKSYDVLRDEPPRVTFSTPHADSKVINEATEARLRDEAKAAEVAKKALQAATGESDQTE